MSSEEVTALFALMDRVVHDAHLIRDEIQQAAAQRRAENQPVYQIPRPQTETGR